VFAAVAEEVALTLDVPLTAVVRFEADGTATQVGASGRENPFPVGTSWLLDEHSVSGLVARTGRPARVDDYADVPGEIAATLARNAGIHTAVGVPVLVDGRPWGVMMALSTLERPLHDGIETQLAAFTELVATAIANTQARDDLGLVVAEQTALRRVATLVGRGTSPTDVFASVAEEVGQLLGVDVVNVVHHDRDETATAVASWSATGGAIPLGSRLSLDGPSIIGTVARTGRPARIDNYDNVPAAITYRVEGVTILAGVGVPIVVEGGVWGTVVVLSVVAGPLPRDTEARLAAFTELVGVAIADTQAREELRGLAEEQAALRRVAVLVAQAASPAEVFAAVAEEVGLLLGVDVVNIVRHDRDETATAVASWSAIGGTIPIGSRLPLVGPSIMGAVARTGRPARIDSYTAVPDAVTYVVEGVAIRAGVGAPITVEGRVWGTVVALSAGGEPLPGDTEARLSAFTELAAVAIADTHAREELRDLAEEQAALRRVATLVAEDAPPVELFRAVAVEVGTLLGADFSGMARLADGTVTPLAAWAAQGEHPALPERWPMQPGDPVTAIAEAQRAVRWDDWAGIPGPIAAFIRDELGVCSTVGTPIVVEGRMWGVLAVHSRQPLPQGSESRMEQFSDLLATALGNAAARGEVARLANEQAALRRIATLVAGGALPAQVFAAVTEETAATFDAVAAVTRFEHDPPGIVLAGVSKEIGIPIGTRLPFTDGMTTAVVYDTGRPARLGAVDWASQTGSTADAALRLGVASQVACPIVVDGSLWGALTINAVTELPPDAERRLENFTDLVTTAIANAEAGIALRTAADEQGALRRVATLVAASAAPDVVFAAVAEEIALVLRAEATLLCRADRDGAAVVVGSRGESTPRLGTRIPRGGTNLTTIVLDTGRPARIESYDEATGDASAVARSHGLRSAVGAPILVEGRLWGLVIAGITSDDTLAPNAEERLAGFTELVATAISNAQAHEDLTSLAEQQAALRRVATLVARRVAPEVVFRAVADEAGRLLGAELSALVRIESDDTVTVIAGPPAGPHEWGDRVTIDPSFVVNAVRETGRPARFETDDPAAEGMPEIVRRLGVRSAVASPIVVEGALWGAVILGSFGESFPPETEQRLDEFTELVATGISNATARAELLASRARIVAAGDEARRRIQRNLHDGTQQRLISLGFAVRVAEADLPPEREDLHAQLSDIATGLAAAVEDLREVSRGIHPTILSRGGLGPALQALAHRSAIPVDLDIRTDERIAEPIEIAAYFVASEALANAAKHSQASRIEVSLEQRERSLLLSIGDDGVGGADAARGSGIVGLTDRVEALGGSIRLTSRPGEGTQVTAEFPRELELRQPLAG